MKVLWTIFGLEWVFFLLQLFNHTAPFQCACTCGFIMLIAALIADAEGDERELKRLQAECDRLIAEWKFQDDRVLGGK